MTADNSQQECENAQDTWKIASKADKIMGLFAIWRVVRDYSKYNSRMNDDGSLNGDTALTITGIKKRLEYEYGLDASDDFVRDTCAVLSDISNLRGKSVGRHTIKELFPYQFIEAIGEEGLRSGNCRASSITSSKGGTRRYWAENPLGIREACCLARYALCDIESTGVNNKRMLKYIFQGVPRLEREKLSKECSHVLSAGNNTKLDNFIQKVTYLQRAINGDGFEKHSIHFRYPSSDVYGAASKRRNMVPIACKEMNGNFYLFAGAQRDLKDALKSKSKHPVTYIKEFRIDRIRDIKTGKPLESTVYEHLDDLRDEVEDAWRYAFCGFCSNEPVKATIKCLIPKKEAYLYSDFEGFELFGHDEQNHEFQYKVDSKGLAIWALRWLDVFEVTKVERDTRDDRKRRHDARQVKPEERGRLLLAEEDTTNSFVKNIAERIASSGYVASHPDIVIGSILDTLHEKGLMNDESYQTMTDDLTAWMTKSQKNN